ncbi:MAG: ABC transporter ATP-binding protein [Clostridia bacterium]|nr:ABC transporter ATP-binding protein [Clostridia bacterium]
MFENVFNMFCKNSKLPYIEMKLKQEAYNKAINTDYKYIDNPEYYDNYSWAINQYAAKSQEAQGLLNRIASSVITVASMLTIITILSPIAIAVTVLGTIIENLLHIKTNYHDVKKDEELVSYNRKIGYYHRIFYTSKYAADLKSTNLNKQLMSEYENVQNEKISVIKKYAKRMIVWELSADFTFYFARTFVILNIVYGIFVGDISTIGAYVTLMLAVDKLKDSMNDMFYYVKDANKLSIYAGKIKLFFDTESSIENNKTNGITPYNGAFDIEIDNVDFRYENSDFNLNKLTLKINKGEKIAIVGENGVGKSTLVKLLLRLYDVNSGDIKINGINIKNYNLEKLRAKIGVAFQNANMYAMSFKKNIELYNEVDGKNLKNIVERFEFDRIFEKNKADFNSVVTKEFDEKGIMLSGGEI